MWLGVAGVVGASALLMSVVLPASGADRQHVAPSSGTPAVSVSPGISVWAHRVLVNSRRPTAEGVEGAITPLPIDADADYQLGGASPVPPGVAVVARDWTENPAGDYAICYLNAFQTQPGELAWWRRKHPDLLLRHRGRLVSDPHWPGEVLLDIRTDARRRALVAIFAPILRTCAEKGFDAVEPDNVDSWVRSRGRISQRDALAFSRGIVRVAHSSGLAVAQKNAAALLRRRASVGWDFAVVEECHVYRECRRFLRAYDDAVVEIEYDDAGGLSNFRAACRSHGSSIAIVYRDRNLAPRGRPGYVYDSC